MTAYAELVALAERGRELVRAERWDELPTLAAAQASARAALVGTPPAEALPYLERALELEREIHAVLSAARAFTLQKLSGLDRGATAVRGYATAAARPVVGELSTQV